MAKFTGHTLLAGDREVRAGFKLVGQLGQLTHVIATGRCLQCANAHTAFDRSRHRIVESFFSITNFAEQCARYEYIFVYTRISCADKC